MPMLDVAVDVPIVALLGLPLPATTAEKGCFLKNRICCCCSINFGDEGEGCSL